ncbi:MAG: hypothetical protein Q9210_005143 [Variospora velana]
MLLRNEEAGYSEGLKNWAVAAQEHMSFLHNRENNQVWKYSVGGGAEEEEEGGGGGGGGGGGAAAKGKGRRGGREREKGFLLGGKREGKGKVRRRTWDMHGQRIQINMIAIWGDDVLDNAPVPDDDEAFLGVELVARLGRRAVVDMNAIAVHFAFRHQRVGMERTDLLARYKALAEERVCRR